MAHESVSRRALVVILVASMAFVNCTKYHPIRVEPLTAPGVEARSIKPGDHVRLELQDGRKVKFRVASLQSDSLTSEHGERVMFSDIATAERGSRADKSNRYGLIRATAPPSGVTTRSIKPGDTVRLQLRSGHQVTFKVATIDADAVFSTEGLRVPISDIAIVERRFGVVRVITPYLFAGAIVGVLTYLLIRADRRGCLSVC
jgi:hypothetical protein